MSDEVEIPEILHHPLAPKDQTDSVSAADERSEHGGLYLYGVVRARGWRGLERRDKQLQRVRYRDIEALVKPTAFELPAERDPAVKAHQQVVETVMRRTTILPVPFGVVFKGRRPLIRFLQEQYLVLDEGLALLDGHWELRLHISAGAGAGVRVDAGTGAETLTDELGDEAMSIYTELRRFSRAAVPFPSDSNRLLSAAFLVDRTGWVEFIERIEGLGEHYTALSFDVTGPWPAYDFVRVITA